MSHQPLGLRVYLDEIMTGRAAANSAIVGDDDDDDDVAKATVSNHIASRDIDIAK